jgi:hypothetical protein
MNNRFFSKFVGLVFLSTFFGGICAGEKEKLGSAISRNEIGIVRQLLQNNSTLVNADLGAQFRPLHYAAEAGFVEIAKLLLDLGANVNAQNQQGQTPLYLAASEGHVALVRLLLERGANKSLRDRVFRSTPLEEAKKNRYNEIISLLEGTNVVAVPVSREVPQVIQQPIAQNIPAYPARNAPVRAFPKLEEAVIVEEVTKKLEPKKPVFVEPVQVQQFTQVQAPMQTLQKQTSVFGAGAKSQNLPVIKKQTLDGVEVVKKNIGEVQTYKTKQVNLQALDQALISLEQVRGNVLELRTAVMSASEK